MQVLGKASTRALENTCILRPRFGASIPPLGSFRWNTIVTALIPKLNDLSMYNPSVPAFTGSSYRMSAFAVDCCGLGFLYPLKSTNKPTLQDTCEFFCSSLDVLPSQDNPGQARTRKGCFANSGLRAQQCKVNLRPSFKDFARPK